MTRDLPQIHTRDWPDAAEPERDLPQCRVPIAAVMTSVNGLLARDVH